MESESSYVAGDSDLGDPEIDLQQEDTHVSYVNYNLTHLQEEIVYAIESLNYSFFIDLGGELEINLDFEIDKDGMFPLGIACAKSSTSICKMILENPTVDIHRTTKYGVNCFWLACENGKDEILPILLEYKINHLTVSNDGRNALHAATLNHKTNVVDYLISIQFPLNIRVKDGVTAVAIAAQNGFFDIVNLLIEAGVNINKLSNKGIGALYLAIENGHIDIAKFLVKRGAKIVLSTKYRDSSPLFLVIKTQNVEMLQYFKKHDVDLTAKNSQGFNPLQYASMLGLTKIMNYLIKRMPNLDQEDDSGFTIFSRYLLMEKFDICKKLLDSGCEINHININGKTPLHMAVECKKVNAIEFLIKRGANPHIEDFNRVDVCEKIKQYNFDLDDETMFKFVQCRPDKKVKIEFNQVQKEHEQAEIENNSEEGSSDDNEDVEEVDKESLMAFERQSSSSSESATDGTSDIMGATGSSFWVSDVGSISPSKLKTKETFDSQKFIAKLKEDSNKDVSDGFTEAAKDKNASSSFKPEKKDSNLHTINIEKAKPSDADTQNNNVSKKSSEEGKNMLSPTLKRTNPDEMSHQNSLNSMVSNPFNIKIIEDGEPNEFIMKKSRNSSLKNSIEKANKQKNGEAEAPNQGSPDKSKADPSDTNSGQTKDNTIAPADGGEEPKTAKKKKKVIKKKKKKGTDEPTTPISKPGAEDEGKESDPKPSEANPEDQPESGKPKEPVQLHGLNNIEKPVDLDKLLLSDQTNGAVSKAKKKKIKKKKTKKVTDEEANGDAKTDDKSKTNSDPTAPGVSDSNEVKLNGLSGSQDSKNAKDPIFSDDSQHGKGSGSSRIGATTPLSQLSGKKELGELKGVRGKSTPKNSQKSSKVSNASVLDGGDMDVNSFIKNIKQIEDEKNQAKRELMSKSKVK